MAQRTLFACVLLLCVSAAPALGEHHTGPYIISLDSKETAKHLVQSSVANT